MLDSIYNVSRTFVTEKVGEAFKLSSDINANSFINALKRMNLHRSNVRVRNCCCNWYVYTAFEYLFDQKETGSDGFVGVEGRQKDNSAGFWGLKGLAAAVFGGGILASIGLKDGLKRFIEENSI